MKHPVDAARNLRQNQTDAEKKLWDCLRNRQLDGLKFRRQHPVPPYTVDFFCEEKGLIIEIDGGQHTPENTKNAPVFWKIKGIASFVSGSMKSLAILRACCKVF